jgi:hypothetical protein
MLSLKERYTGDGIAIGEVRGEARGITKGATMIVELIKSGFSPEEALRKINEETQ